MAGGGSSISPIGAPSAQGTQGIGGGNQQHSAEDHAIWKTLSAEQKQEVKQARQSGNTDSLSELVQSLQSQQGGSPTATAGANPIGAAGGILQSAMGSQVPTGDG